MSKGASPAGDRAVVNGAGQAASAVPASVPSADAPVCIECARTASLVTGERIYPHRPDLFDRSFWLCACGAYCGTHRGTTEPLGYPCGAATRRARSRAHAAFDPLWRGKGAPMQRGDAYKWLAKRLGIDKRDCHIGMMDAQMADAAARFSLERAAQAIEARRAATGTGAVNESAVPQGCAPTTQEPTP